MYIIENHLQSPAPSFLQLDRTNSVLNIYQQAPATRLRATYPIRSDFDESGYTMYDREKTIPCLFGGTGKTQTPHGLFTIQQVTNSVYISGYRPGVDQVKLFGHLDIFEDYFIHADMYNMTQTESTFRNAEPLSRGDTHTQGCIRVNQADLDWLIANISVGTLISM